MLADAVEEPALSALMVSGRERKGRRRKRGIGNKVVTAVGRRIVDGMGRRTWREIERERERR